MTMRLKLAFLLFAGMLLVAGFQWAAEQTVASVQALVSVRSGNQ